MADDIIRIRRDSLANWTTVNPVLSVGEISYDTTSEELRIGDGTTPWLSLPAVGAGGGGGGGGPSSTEAPKTASYIVRTADGTLTNETVLGSLATGLLKNTTTTGVLSIATGTDLPSHNHAASAITSGIINYARLGYGTPTSTMFLNGEQEWSLVGQSNIDVAEPVIPTDVTTKNYVDQAVGLGYETVLSLINEPAGIAGLDPSGKLLSNDSVDLVDGMATTAYVREESGPSIGTYIDDHLDVPNYIAKLDSDKRILASSLPVAAITKRSLKYSERDKANTGRNGNRVMHTDGTSVGDFVWSTYSAVNPTAIATLVHTDTYSYIQTEENQSGSVGRVRHCHAGYAGINPDMRLDDCPKEFKAYVKYDGPTNDSTVASVGYVGSHGTRSQLLACFDCLGTTNWWMRVVMGYTTTPTDRGIVGSYENVVYYADTGIPVNQFTRLGIRIVLNEKPADLWAGSGVADGIYFYSEVPQVVGVEGSWADYNQTTLGSYPLTGKIEDVFGADPSAYAGLELRQRDQGTNKSSQKLYFKDMTYREYNDYANFAELAHTHTLADLTQSAATDGQVITWDSGTSAWVPETPSGGGGGGATTLDGLTDVTITAPVTGDSMYYSSTYPGGWTNQSRTNYMSGYTIAYPQVTCPPAQVGSSTLLWWNDDAGQTRTVTPSGTGIASLTLDSTANTMVVNVPASHAHALSDLTTTGTASATNFLRGDGAWSDVSDVHTTVKNMTGSTITKGTVVYISGANGQTPLITKAIATSDPASAQTLGLVSANIADNATGTVMIMGLMTGLDTSAFSDGDQLYLSPVTAGALTATKPVAPDHLVYVAVVAHSNPSVGKLLVKVQNGYELNEIHDALITSPTTGQVLTYDSVSSLWKNQTPGVYVTDTDKGDISVSGSGTIWTIDTGAVTNTKLAANSVLNSKIGTGAVTLDKIVQLPSLTFPMGNLLETANSSGEFSSTFYDVGGASPQIITPKDAALTYAKMQNVSAHDKLLGRSTAGAGVVEEIACTAAGRALLDDIDASAQRTTLGLGALATLANAPAGTLTGTTLAAGVTASSLTSVGTLAALTVTATIAGSVNGNAATVTTNANLTGHITSSGNATSLGSFTSLELKTALSDETGSGAAVFATSPTLVTPLLGTPTSGVLTNCTGTASGLTAGNVTTNANLTGHITSSGNATSLGSFTSLELKTALSDETGSGAAVFATSPTLVTPILGTPTSGNLSNCSNLPSHVHAGTDITTGTVAAARLGSGTTDNTTYLRGDNQWVSVSAAPAGSTTQIQYNNAGAAAGATNIVVDSDNLRLLDTSITSATATGGATLFSKKLGLFHLPSWNDERGVWRNAQVCVGRNRVGFWVGNNNVATAPVAVNVPTPTAIGGTLTARNMAATSVLASTRKVGIVSAGTAAAITGWRTTNAFAAFSSTATVGGGQVICRFAISDASLVTGARTFIGINYASSNYAAGTEVDTLLNQVGFAQLTGAANPGNLYILSNDGTGTATKTDTGYAINTTDLLEATFQWIPGNSSLVGYRLDNLTSGNNIVEGTLTTDLPVNNTLLHFHMWRTNGATAAAVGLDMAQVYFETYT